MVEKNFEGGLVPQEEAEVHPQGEVGAVPRHHSVEPLEAVLGEKGEGEARVVVVAEQRHFVDTDHWDLELCDPHQEQYLPFCLGLEGIT